MLCHAMLCYATDLTASVVSAAWLVRTCGLNCHMHCKAVACICDLDKKSYMVILPVLHPGDALNIVGNVGEWGSTQLICMARCVYEG